jgi:hypothetical protein
MDMANQLAHTNIVVRRHSGAKTRYTLSSQESMGPRRAWGIICDARESPLYEARLASIEVLLIVDRRLGGLGRAGGRSSPSEAEADGDEVDATGGEPEGVCDADS